MPNWYFSKEGLLRTPSRLDGIDYTTEIRYRREGTRFIMNCGNRMRLYPNLIFSFRKCILRSFPVRYFGGSAAEYCAILATSREAYYTIGRDKYKCTYLVKFANHSIFFIFSFRAVVTEMEQV